MIKRLTSVLLSILILFTMLSACAGEGTQEQKLKSRESWNGVVEVLGRTYIYYAQNSPEWEDLRADEFNHRRIGGGGCVAVSFATALVNVLPFSSLPRISRGVKKPIRIDTRSAILKHGLRTRDRFEITEDADYLRYFPLCVANYAAGNNVMNAHRPQSTAFYSYLAKTMGAEMTVTKSTEEALDALRNGAIFVTNSFGKYSPFSTVGHFFTVVACDDDYIYILDPYVRDTYPKDTYGIIEPVERGVIRIRIENLTRAWFGEKYILYPSEDRTVYTRELYSEIIAESDRVLADVSSCPDAR